MAEPKIKHTNVAKDRKKLKAVVQAFATQMLKSVDGMKSIDVPFENPTEEDLLKFRKHLVDAVKAGMLERKDLEDLIGKLAAIVWFMRLTKDEQDRITGLW